MMHFSPQLPSHAFPLPRKVNCLDEDLELRQFGTLPGLPLKPSPLTPGQPGKSGTAGVTATATTAKNKLFSPLSTEQPVELTPSGLKCTVSGQTSVGWHRYDGNRGTNVQIRCASSAWSLGMVDMK